MSNYRTAVNILNAAVGDPDRQEEALELFSTHTNLDLAVDLLKDHVNGDNIESIDQTINLLTVLVERHRHGHHPNQAPPRATHKGVVRSGTIDDPVRIETDRFHLWVYPVENTDQVEVEFEAR